MSVIMPALMVGSCAVTGGGLVALVVWDVRHHRRLGSAASSLVADRLVAARKAAEDAATAAMGLAEAKTRVADRPLRPSRRTPPPQPAPVGGIRGLRSPARVTRRGL